MSFNFKKTIRRIDYSPNLHRLLNELRKYPPLSIEEELELFSRYKSGDKLAGEKILKHNLKFVITIARNYSREARDIEDNIGAGSEGMSNALENYNPTYGFKFISFAVKYIKGYIFNQFVKIREVHVPKTRAGTQLNDIKDMLSDGYSEEEIVELTGVDIASIRRIKNGPVVVTSLSASYGSEEATLLDIIPAEDESLDLDEEYRKKYLAYLLSKIPDKQSAALKHLYGIGGYLGYTSLPTVASNLGISRQGAEHLVKKGLKNLQKIAN